MRRAAVTLLAWLALLALASLAFGCTARPAPRRISAPAPSVVTAPLAVAHRAIRAHAGAAQTRTETIVKTIESIRLETDPATAAALGAVQMELFKVSADLREAQEALTEAETKTVIIAQQADALRAWGLEQQLTAEANATGWQREESAHTQTKGAIEKLKAALSQQTRLTWKWRFLTFGLFAAGAAFFIARQYFPILKFL